jgi:hypothetical protein
MRHELNYEILYSIGLCTSALLVRTFEYAYVP